MRFNSGSKSGGARHTLEQGVPALDVLEDLADQRRVFDTGDNPELAAAIGAGLDGDLEHSFESLRPIHGGGRFVAVHFAAGPVRHDASAVFAVGCEDPVEAGGHCVSRFFPAADGRAGARRPLRSHEQHRPHCLEGFRYAPAEEALARLRAGLSFSGLPHHNRRMSKRECGSCTACCEGWLVADELDMRAGRPCRHCTQSGCAIYENRPENPCIRFKCVWLQEDSPLPEEMRPDRSGVIVLSDRTWHDWKVIMAIPAGLKVPEDSLEWLRVHAAKLRLPLVFHERNMDGGEYTGVKVRGYGSPAFAEAVKYSIGPEDVVKM